MTNTSAQEDFVLKEYIIVGLENKKKIVLHQKKKKEKKRKKYNTHMFFGEKYHEQKLDVQNCN